MSKFYFDIDSLKCYEVNIISKVSLGLIAHNLGLVVHDVDQPKTNSYYVCTEDLADSKPEALKLALPGLNDEYLNTQRSVLELQKRCTKIQELIQEATAQA